MNSIKKKQIGFLRDEENIIFCIRRVTENDNSKGERRLTLRQWNSFTMTFIRQKKQVSRPLVGSVACILQELRHRPHRCQ